jgi:hypothetical protein
MSIGVGTPQRINDLLENGTPISIRREEDVSNDLRFPLH